MGLIDIRGNNQLLRDDGNVSPSSAPSKFDKQIIRGIPSSGKDKVVYQTINTQVRPIGAQPTSTEVDNGTADDFAVDAYRSGGGSGEIANPRALDDGEEQIANMTLAAGDENIISAYSRFFLQSVTEGEQEKYQIVETFTSFYAFFYGKRPAVYRYAGLLLNDENFKWNNDFKFVYENYFRGTRAVELQGQVIMQYDGRLVTGFPLSFTMQQEAMNPKGIPFAMDVLVTDHITLNFSKDIAALFEAKTRDLQRIRLESNRNLARMNSNVPSTQYNLARQVTNGDLPANSTTDATKTPETKVYTFGDPNATAARQSSEMATRVVTGS